MGKLQAFFGGKSHLIVWVAIILGSGAFALSVLRHDSTGLSPYLTFLIGMSGVQVGRSIGEDFKPK